MATTNSFLPTTQTIRKTVVKATSPKNPAIAVKLSAIDTGFPTASFSIDLDMLGFANARGCVTRLAKTISATYEPIHQDCYNDLTHWHGARFWWRSENLHTPFASYCNPTQIEGFMDHMHDHDFIIELCKKFEEEALNVVKAIEQFWSSLDAETQKEWLATPDTGIRL